MRHLTPLLLLLVLASACSSQGQLAQTTLSPPCPAGDATCAAEGAHKPIATGAVLALDVKPVIAGGIAVPFTLRAVDEAVAAVDDQGRVVATGPGVTAVLVVAEDGSVLDMTHVAVADIDRVTFHRGGGADLDERQLPERIQLFPNEELTLSLRVWRAGQQLDGEMGDAWAVDNGDFRVVDQGFALERRVQAPAEGQTALTVNVLGVQQLLILEVVP